MKTRLLRFNARTAARFRRALALAALACAAALAPPDAFAQQTAGGTQIQNRASATYSDGTTSYSTVSNQVTVTVANVAGIAITPDAGGGTVVAGNTNASVTFTLSNTGNFDDTVSFKPGGASLTVGGAINSSNLTAAFVDANGNGTFDAGDVNILAAGAGDILSPSIARGASMPVVVRFSVPAGASGSVTVQLGDAATGGPTFDGQTLAASAADVANTTAGVNGRSEARGDYSLTVLADTAIRTTLTAPAGPIAPGSDITYQINTCNVATTQTANAVTLPNAPAGSNSGVFEVFPVPAQTTLAAGQTFPAGTLYSTDPLSTTSPTGPPPAGLSPAATWTTTAPANLVLVRRVAFNRGASLAAGACTSNVAVRVTIDTNANANIPVLAIADSFAANTFGSPITDQSGDSDSNRGNGRADLSPAGSNADGSNLSQPGGTDGDGVLQPTLIARQGVVLNGPNGAPAAVGPNNNNDDFTNRSVSTGIATVAPGGNTNAAGNATFTNTVQNAGNADDTYTLTVPNFATLPAGTSLVITTPSGSVTVDSSNPTGSVQISVPRNSTADYTVVFNLPTNQLVLTGYAATIRATSANTPAQSNDTIDRLYTGFFRLLKTATVINGTGVGGATDAVPGAEIEYTISYSNVSLAGPAGNGTLTATNVVISEDGDAGGNNWASNTTQVINPPASAPSDSLGGTITDGDTNGAVTATTTFLKDSITSVGPGQSGTFKFRRRIN